MASVARRVSAFWGVAVVQLVTLGTLAAWWSYGSSDATSTSVDTGFVVAVVATPLLLALTIGLRWRRVPLEDDTIVPRLVHAVTCLAFVLAFVLMPIGLIGAVVLGPMG